MNDEKLSESFGKFLEIQKSFMNLLHEKRNFPQFPVDLQSKSGQKLLKDISHDCIDELVEGIQHLKNSKSYHRETNVSDFDREAYIEELVDAFKYFTEILLLSGVSASEFCDVFVKKTNKNIDRINNGY